MSRSSVGAALKTKVDTDLAQRTLQGTFGHPATLVLLYFTTGIAAEHPGQFWFGASLMMGLILLRIPLLAGQAKRDPSRQNRWRCLMMVNIFASAAVWGVSNWWVCTVDGYQSRDATLLVLYISAICGAGMHLLVQSVRLVACYLAVLMGPVCAAACLQGKPGMWLSVAVLFYYFYLVGQAKRLHGQYWQQLRDNEQLSIRAHMDSLTGLPNRLAFRDRLTAAIASAREKSRPVSLLYIDMDGFKQINDRFSHRIGDLFLCEIAQRLKSFCGTEASPFRLGGDEFTVLLPAGADPESASRFARQLLEKIRETITIDGHTLTASASIGVSIFPLNCENEDDLLRTADHAMYRAKASGKGSYEVFDIAQRSERVPTVDLAREMRQALDCEQFALHYQPQVNQRGELTGFEALLRWNHPTLGNIPPLDFVPVAEETGLIAPLGLWVVREACQQGSAWLSEGCDAIQLSVNVSPIQLQRPEFVENLLRILRETGFPPHLLTLEVTEGILEEKHQSAFAQLSAIRSRGPKIAIDDFGTGYSSLSRIHELPIDILKLDRSFISAVQKLGDRAPIIEAVLAMARSLHFDVVAEGVEMPEQFEMLTRMGCEFFQGYYFGKASPAGSARQYWRKSAELLLARSA